MLKKILVLAVCMPVPGICAPQPYNPHVKGIPIYISGLGGGGYSPHDMKLINDEGGSDREYWLYLSYLDSQKKRCKHSTECILATKLDALKNVEVF